MTAIPAEMPAAGIADDVDGLSDGARRRPRPAAPPLRLTRRGRVVAAVASVLVAATVTSLLSLAAAGGALASSHGQARAGYAGLHQVVVEPGQTLWSIASAVEPDADPRVVIPQIMQANSLTGATIRSGQVLWVP